MKNAVRGKTMGNFYKEWKNIKGYETLYKVSNYGEIKAKRRVIYKIIDDERQPIFVTKEKIMSPVNHGNGYLYITLIDEFGNRKNHYVHRLVAEAFIPNPNNLPQVNHRDYDRKNNKVTNLEWCSSLENIRHSRCNQPRFHETSKKSFGYKYIGIKNGKYRVNIRIDKGKHKFDKMFKTLEEAISYRDTVLRGLGIEIKDNINKVF